MTEKTHIVAVTERMLLRRFTMDDVDHLYMLDGDPEVMRFLSDNRTPREFIRDTFLPGVIRTYERFPGFGHWAAIDKRTREFVGWFGLRLANDDAQGEPELGYRLRRRYWGQGLATEGSRCAIEMAFSMPEVQRVWAQTMAVNVGSRRVMEKCGMRYVRTFHEYFDHPLPGTEFGEVEYEIQRGAWQAGRQ